MSSSGLTAPDQQSKLKILLFGPIGNEVSPFCDKLMTLQASKAGPFDAAFCVGSCHVISLVQQLKDKQLSLPLPVYLQEPVESIESLLPLVASNKDTEHGENGASSSSPPPTKNEEDTQQTPDDKPKSQHRFLLQVHENLYLLRNRESPHRASVWSLPIKSTASFPKWSELVVAVCPSHLRSDSDQVTDLMQTMQHVSYRGCDLLLSTEWPQGIETVLTTTKKTTTKTATMTTEKEDNLGTVVAATASSISYDIAHVALQARARYHVAVSSAANNHCFVQSPPFQHLASTTSTVPIYHSGRFLALASVVDANTLKQRGGSKQTKFVHALGLKPLLQMSVAELQRDSGGSTMATLSCPFTDAAYQLDDVNQNSSSIRHRTSGTRQSGISTATGSGGLSEASARRILAEEQSKPSGATIAARRWATRNSNHQNNTNNNDDDETDIDPTNQTLFVHGLHKDVTGLLQSSRGDAVLLRAFRPFEAVQIRKPPNAATSSFAFVDFPSHAQALTCWKDHRANGITVSGVQLDVRWATSKKRKQPSNLKNNNDNENDNDEALPSVNKRTRLTEATAQDSSTVYYKLPSELAATTRDRKELGETLRVWMEQTLEDALAPPADGDDNSNNQFEERVTAANEPALRVQISFPDKQESPTVSSPDGEADALANYGFLEFASHAAASMALATLTGSTDGGTVLPDAPRLPGSEYNGLRMHWGHGKKNQKEKDVIEDASGFKFERKHFPADARKDCWFCLASDACEKHLITGVYDKCYTAMPKGPVHPGHVLLIPVQHEDQGALKNVPVADEMENIKAKLYQHAAAVYDMDMFVFERAIRTRGGYHTHVQCVPIAKGLGTKLHATMMTQARKIGIPLREISSDLGMTALVRNHDDNDDDDGNAKNSKAKENSGYFYAEIVSSSTSSSTPQRKRFLYKASQQESSGTTVAVPLQFGREILAAVMGKPEIAHWKSCVASQEEETKLAKQLRDSLAKFTK
ncbi:hypothetical protein ACA910_015471 [Epithemia clementina (nom. ined.)]